MPQEQEGGTTLIPLFDRLAAGDTSAADEIIEHAMQRLKVMAKQRLRSFPKVHQLHQTDDVVQNAAMRLHRALKEVVPTSPGHLTRLCAEQIRRELIDLKRREYGVRGDRVQVQFGVGGSTTEANAILDGKPEGETENEERREMRAEIDELVDRLPVEERAVFEMVFYQGLPYGDVAHQLGVSLSTVKRRWFDAQDALHRLLATRSTST